MSGDDGLSARETRSAPSPHDLARPLVRLIQCPRCSRPFRLPVTLPCGHSFCRSCLPQPHLRDHISYPDTPDRRHGYVCPEHGCEWEHPTGECNVDVTLAKLMDSVSLEVVTHSPVVEDTPTLLEYTVPDPDHAATAHARSEKEMMVEEKEVTEKNTAQSIILHGGRLLATFVLAEMGQLDIAAEVRYETLSPEGDDYRSLDETLVDRLRETTQKELECHVCYNLMLDPVTTPCGHTFCRRCLARVLDHSSQCPMCRRTLSLPPSLDRQPSNVRLAALLSALCPDTVASRAATAAAEERGVVGELDVPLFVCTLAFPSMPTFLHIFEPRYRLMIRRALEGNGQFGMLMYNRTGSSQGSLGQTPFLEYGTMLQILNVQMLPDGRSLIETNGIGRFRVRAWGQLDGYTVGNVEKVEDVSLAEEERLEAEETRSAEGAVAGAGAVALAGSPPSEPGRQQPAGAAANLLDQLSTRELLAFGVDFINRMRANSAPWLHQRILDSYGEPPNDPAVFPYWFAGILPIVDEEKYLLLQTTSVRQRLKIVVGWIRRVERQRW